MSFSEEIATIALCALATILTRAVPFLVFSGKKPTPPYVRYLGDALPAAIFAMLVVYCLKDVAKSYTPELTEGRPVYHRPASRTSPGSPGPMACRSFWASP